jgi:DNA-binding CsgD family transcriptional regulator
MSKLALRLQDVRSAFRVIGDCRDAGDDTSQWQELAMQALTRLVGAVAVAGGEGYWHRPLKPPAPVSAYSVGLDASGQILLSTYMRAFGTHADPVFRGLQDKSGRLETVRRGELVPDRDWYRAPTFVHFLRPAGLDHSLTSIYQRPRGDAISVFRIARAKGDRDFTDRERGLAAFFHYELGRLIGRSLASVLDSDLEPLPPRLRETLAYLLDGDSEKQVAMRMGLSHATVHQYVTMLYRRFDVRSRAELMARVLRRRVIGHGHSPR